MPDVIVVGGGPAGSATAMLMAAQGRRVTLFDAATFPRPKACAEYLSPGAVDVLGRLGVLEQLPLETTGRWLDGMRIVAPGGMDHALTYGGDDDGRRRSLSVSRLVLDATLLHTARSRGVDVRERSRVRDVWTNANGHVRGVVTSSGERLPADLVVGADGLGSVLARSSTAGGGMHVRVWPRRLGLVAHVGDVAWPETYGQMRVGRRGYVGVAPLDAKGTLTVGYVGPMPRGRLGSPTDALYAGLAEFPDLSARIRAGRLMGPVRGVGPLARQPRRVAGPGFALVGDAAGFFDPFSGEGIYRALRGAELLSTHEATYAIARQRTFAAKERLVALLQAVVRAPALMDFAIRRLQQRQCAAQDLALILGDLRPARLSVAWRLLGP
ncbi:MAG: NAD(P)/FAD-dependent oxidoreductase [Chloroflexota bacterium]